MGNSSFPLLVDGNHRNGQSNYKLMFGDEGWAIICSLIHSGIIRSGNSIQDQITELIPEDLIANFDDICRVLPASGKSIVPLYRMPTSNGKSKAVTPDYLVLIHHKRICYVVEVKLGASFDTGKAPAAKKDLETVADHIMSRTGYNTRIRICSLMAKTKKEVVYGFKNNFGEDEVLLGGEFCQMVHVRFDDVLGAMLETQDINLQDIETLVRLRLGGADKDTIIDKVNELRTLHGGQPRLL